MIKLKNIFKKKLNEQSIPTSTSTNNTGTVKTNDEAQAIKLAKQGLNVSLEEDQIEEAELVNHMYDYRGGVEYVLRDPSQAEEVSQSIRNWTERKGFTIIKHKLSRSGRVGYFYFRLGPDPERDAQRIQGYFSSKIEISKFRFNVREKRQAPAPEAPQAPQPEI